MNSRIIKFIKKPSLLFISLGHREYFNWMSDEIYLKIAYRIMIGKRLNLNPPITFNEKIQWLKLYDRRPGYRMMVDKCEVKKWVAQKIGEKYIIPTIGVWDKFDEIDFNILPNQFVIKCTHDSGGIIICRDKSQFNIKAARKKIENCLKHNFYWGHREWPYKDVKPRIIVEKYMAISDGNELQDYKFMCFDGKVKCVFVCSGRNSTSGLEITIYDMEWNRMPFERKCPSRKKEIDKPSQFKEMIKLAEKLSKGIIFVRVDFYEVEGNIYFGELTFYPGAGFEPFMPEKWDYKLGEWIILPEKTC